MDFADATLVVLAEETGQMRLLRWIEEVSLHIASAVGKLSKYGRNKKKLIFNTDGSRFLPAPKNDT